MLTMFQFLNSVEHFSIRFMLCLLVTNPDTLPNDDWHVLTVTEKIFCRSLG